MKKLLCFAVTGILAISSSLVCLADEEETTEFNIFEQVDTISTEIVTSVEQATDILSKYIATTTDYTGEVFDTLVENAVNLWQNSYNTALEIAYVTAGGAIDYVVKVSTDLGNAIADYINSNYDSNSGLSNLTIDGVTWYYVAPGTSVSVSRGNFRPTATNNSNVDLYMCTYNSGIVVCSWSLYDSNVTQEWGNGPRGSSSVYSRIGSYNGYLSSANSWSLIWYGPYETASQAQASFYGYEIPEDITASNTPTNIITSSGIGSVNWSNVGGDSTIVNNEYNNIENTYNYVSDGYNTAEIETYGAEAGLSYLESAYDNLNEVPDVDYNYNFIQAVYFAIPTKIKAIIGLSLTMAMIAMLLGFKSGGLTK